MRNLSIINNKGPIDKLPVVARPCLLAVLACLCCLSTAGTVSESTISQLDDLSDMEAELERHETELIAAAVPTTTHTPLDYTFAEIDGVKLEIRESIDARNFDKVVPLVARYSELRTKELKAALSVMNSRVDEPADVDTMVPSPAVPAPAASPAAQYPCEEAPGANTTVFALNGTNTRPLLHYAPMLPDGSSWMIMDLHGGDSERWEFWRAVCDMLAYSVAFDMGLGANAPRSIWVQADCPWDTAARSTVHEDHPRPFIATQVMRANTLGTVNAVACLQTSDANASLTTCLIPPADQRYTMRTTSKFCRNWSANRSVVHPCTKEIRGILASLVTHDFIFFNTDRLTADGWSNNFFVASQKDGEHTNAVENVLLIDPGMSLMEVSDGGSHGEKKADWLAWLSKFNNTKQADFAEESAAFMHQVCVKDGKLLTEAKLGWYTLIQPMDCVPNGKRVCTSNGVNGFLGLSDCPLPYHVTRAFRASRSSFEFVADLKRGVGHAAVAALSSMLSNTSNADLWYLLATRFECAKQVLSLKCSEQMAL
jgi:hypothetical protein